MTLKPRFPGIRVTANGNQLVSYHTESRIADAGVFYPITPSTEGGELALVRSRCRFGIGRESHENLLGNLEPSPGRGRGDWARAGAVRGAPGPACR